VRVTWCIRGDLDGRKGIYEINLVDEVTQHEFVGAGAARRQATTAEPLLGDWRMVLQNGAGPRHRL